MKRILFLSLLFTCLTLSAQTVTDVDANQVGKTIEITYHLDRTADISVEYSTDGGRTYKPLHRVSGDVGRGITAGYRTITWDVLSELDNLIADVSFRVNATTGKMLITLPTGQSFTMIYVEGGSFMMGCISEQSNCDSDEQPAHRVTVNSYYIGETEVTQELWTAIMVTNKSSFKGSQRPVHYVSWNDCQDFIKKLNSLTGKKFRLPTEAEWEYAARGGKKSKAYKYSGGNTLDNVAWYDKNSGNQIHNVKTKLPNELGIYDMSGNVCEWCQDWYASNYYSSSPQTNPTGPASGETLLRFEADVEKDALVEKYRVERVERGGCWSSSAEGCTLAGRSSSPPTWRTWYCGFRLVLVP